MAGAFEGKVVVVTGGSRGIGRAIAVGLRARGRADRAGRRQRGQPQCRGQGDRRSGALAPLTVAGDLRTLKGCEALFAAVKERFGRCDVLVNNAGATRGGKFLDLPDDAWTDGFALKYFGAVRLTRLFWPLLKEAHGNIIYIVGGAARTPGPDFLIGSSVNAAVANFCQGPRRDRQPRRHQRQCHPSRPDRDRPRGSVVRAIRQGAGQDA